MGVGVPQLSQGSMTGTVAPSMAGASPPPGGRGASPQVYVQVTVTWFTVITPWALTVNWPC